MYGRFDDNGIIVEKLPFVIKGMENLIKIRKELENEKFLKVVNGKVVVNDEFKQLDQSLRRQREYKESITGHIYQSYPQTKQNSDLADKLYYETTLKTKKDADGNPVYPDLEGLVVSKVEAFFGGTSLDDLVTDVADPEAMKQLLKVGIRVTWVQRCKAELHAAISDKREPQYPAYPL